MKNFLKSFLYAFRGLGSQLLRERNFRIHCVAALTVFLLSAFYDFSPVKWCILILLICLILFAECINTAIEQADNAISDQPNEHIRRSKDVAAGGVLILAAGAVAIGFFLFWDPAAFLRIYHYFSVWYRLILAVLYVAAMLMLIFCEKTYKKD